MSVPVKPHLTKRILLFVVIGLATLLLYLFYFIGTENVADTLKQTNVFWYSAR